MSALGKKHHPSAMCRPLPALLLTSEIGFGVPVLLRCVSSGISHDVARVTDGTDAPVCIFLILLKSDCESGGGLKAGGSWLRLTCSAVRGQGTAG
jgi:hypothetical protein